MDSIPDEALEALDVHIEHARNKAEKMERLRSLLEELEDDGEVSLDCRKNDPVIRIWTKQDEVLESMENLYNLFPHNRDNIVYDLESDTYSLTVRFDSNR